MSFYMIISPKAQKNLTLGIVQSRSRSWQAFENFLHLPEYKLSGPVAKLGTWSNRYKNIFDQFSVGHCGSRSRGL